MCRRARMFRSSASTSMVTRPLADRGGLVVAADHHRCEFGRAQVVEFRSIVDQPNPGTSSTHASTCWDGGVAIAMRAGPSGCSRAASLTTLLAGPAYARAGAVDAAHQAHVEHAVVADLDLDVAQLVHAVHGRLHQGDRVGTGDAVGAGSTVADRQHLGARHGLGARQVQLDHRAARMRRGVDRQRSRRAQRSTRGRRRPARPVLHRSGGPRRSGAVPRRTPRRSSTHSSSRARRCGSPRARLWPTTMPANGRRAGRAR